MATDNEARALAIIDAEPGITGAELGRRLNISSRQGQRLLSRLSSPAPTS
ncbi:MarR family transcriptional regulator [Actinomadura geliboluensis]|uniref:MarR family transcriptional regulator n=1 Tax=Actinomadura geliboluensis TaxID=882440 RepID=A0A5S4GHU4_9ACTN|nr:MarR family transcriptional regulator [Actinomadura geliboluensis]